MKIPEIAYRYLYPKDVAGPTFELLNRAFNFNTADTTQIFEIQGIPKDRILILQSFTVACVPGPAQAVTEIAILQFTQARAVINMFHFFEAGTADLNVSHNEQFAYWIQGSGEDVASFRITATFDAGVGSNQMFGGVQGIIIPRGNVAAF